MKRIMRIVRYRVNCAMYWPKVIVLQARIIIGVFGHTFINAPLFAKFLTAHMIHNHENLTAVISHFYFTTPARKNFTLKVNNGDFVNKLQNIIL